MTTTKTAPVKSDLPAVLNIKNLMTDADFAKDCLAINRKGTTLQNDIHRHLYAIAFRWVETGDNRETAGHARRVNNLIEAMPQGLRRNAVREYVEKMFGLLYVEKNPQTATPAHFIMGKATAKALDLHKISNTRWYDFKAEAEYKPLDFAKQLAALIKNAEARMQKPNAADHIDPEAVAKAKAVLAGLRAAGEAA